MQFASGGAPSRGWTRHYGRRLTTLAAQQPNHLLLVWQNVAAIVRPTSKPQQTPIRRPPLQRSTVPCQSHPWPPIWRGVGHQRCHRFRNGVLCPNAGWPRPPATAVSADSWGPPVPRPHPWPRLRPRPMAAMFVVRALGTPDAWGHNSTSTISHPPDHRLAPRRWRAAARAGELLAGMARASAQRDAPARLAGGTGAAGVPAC